VTGVRGGAGGRRRCSPDPMRRARVRGLVPDVSHLRPQSKWPQAADRPARRAPVGRAEVGWPVVPRICSAATLARRRRRVTTRQWTRSGTGYLLFDRDASWNDAERRGGWGYTVMRTRQR
jgi:hypothetical protein